MCMQLAVQHQIYIASPTCMLNIQSVYAYIHALTVAKTIQSKSKNTTKKAKVSSNMYSHREALCE